MKRLDTFIEGLLDKSNKAKTMDISDIDMRNIEELKMALQTTRNIQAMQYLLFLMASA